MKKTLKFLGKLSLTTIIWAVVIEGIAVSFFCANYPSDLVVLLGFLLMLFVVVLGPVLTIAIWRSNESNP